MSKLGSAGLAGAGGILVAFLALPVVALVARAVLGGALGAAATDPGVLRALSLSLATTAASLIVTVTFGTPLAYVLARRRFPGARLVDVAVDLPIVLPPAVAGLALLLVFGSRGALGGAFGAFGVAIPFTTVAVVLAQTFVAAPFFVRAARAGFAAVDRELEDAARIDGGDEWSVFRFVTAPLAGAALAAGLVMTWARALGEFGATILFAGNVVGTTQTLPLLVYAEFQASLDAAIAAAAILALAAFAVLVGIRVARGGSALDGPAMG